MVPARYYSSGPIHIQHGDGGHNINQHEVQCFATTVATNNNASNAMRADNSRDRHEGYANSMHTIQNVKNALIVIKSQTTDTRCNSHLQVSHSHQQDFRSHLHI